MAKKRYPTPLLNVTLRFSIIFTSEECDEPSVFFNDRDCFLWNLEP